MGSEAEREWKASSLEELTADSPITYGVVKPGEEGEIPFIRSGDISDGKIGVDQLRTITAEVSEQYGRTLLSGGELLVSLVGNPGQVARVPRNLAGANIARQVALVRIGGRADPEFIRYALSAPYCQEQLTGFTMGSVQQVINLRDLKKVEILLPPLPEQKAMAHILGTLDDKIELNRRMNATLEGMAQALFKSWFVDFDPVIDNALAASNPIPDELTPRAEVRRQALSEQKTSTTQQGSSDDSTLLNRKNFFPAAFQFTEELGWIPEGWEVKSFDTLAELDTTSVKPFEQPETVWEHYSIPSYDSSGMPSWDRGDEIKSNKYLVKPGAILSSKLNPETERTWWPFMMDEKTSICSTEFMQFVPHNKEEQAFIYSLIRSDPFQANILERVTGSTGSRQRAQPKQIAEIEVIDCGGLLREEFIKISLPLFQSIRNNSLTVQTLTKLRDTLLPKLISGELAV